MKFTLLACTCGADARPVRVRFRVQILQLCGGGPDGDRPYWAEILYVGLTLTRARSWLKSLGWRPYGPLRLRLKGRCWIEDPAKPATARPLGEFCSIHQEENRKAAIEARHTENRERIQRWYRGRGRRQRRPPTA